MPCGCISLPVTFRTPENFHTKSILFFIAEVNLPFKASLGRSGLYQFMAVAHYRYLVLKMLSPNGVLKIMMQASLNGVRPAPRSWRYWWS
jgi:hypothetical protein